jgi:NAD-dependent deacetylase
VTIVTQNVDGLHTAAALVAAGARDPHAALPLELHGALFRNRCTRCGWRAEDRSPVDASRPETLPTCIECGRLARPDIVWFGEPLDEGTLGQAFAAAEEAEVCIVVGTSSLVHPAASIPLVVARRGARMIEVNPERTPLSGLATRELRGPAATLLPQLLEEFR